MQRFVDALKGGPRQVPLLGFRSWIHTHDNHFLWIGSKSLGLLRKLIAASLIGFFHQLRPHAYTPVPDGLIDLIGSHYHTAALVCVPSTYDLNTGKEIEVGVQVDDDRIKALVGTAAESWIAYQLNPPKELVGRGLLIAYDFGKESWSFEEWR